MTGKWNHTLNSAHLGRRGQPQSSLFTLWAVSISTAQACLEFSSAAASRELGLRMCWVPFSAREDLKLKLIQRTESADTTEV